MESLWLRKIDQFPYTQPSFMRMDGQTCVCRAGPESILVAKNVLTQWRYIEQHTWHSSTINLHYKPHAGLTLETPVIVASLASFSSRGRYFWNHLTEMSQLVMNGQAVGKLEFRVYVALPCFSIPEIPIHLTLSWETTWQLLLACHSVTPERLGAELWRQQYLPNCISKKPFKRLVLSPTFNPPFLQIWEITLRKKNTQKNTFMRKRQTSYCAINHMFRKLGNVWQ